MEPHQERVMTEQKELADKVAKLSTFLYGPAFDSLKREEQFRLVKQHGYMRAYLEILDQRIAAF